MMQNQSKPLNHSTLSPYRRYFRSISYEYCIFLIRGLVPVWSAGAVVTDQWVQHTGASHSYLRQEGASSAECFSWLCRIIIGCEIHLGCHIAWRHMMGYRRSTVLCSLFLSEGCLPSTIISDENEPRLGQCSFLQHHLYRQWLWG